MSGGTNPLAAGAPRPSDNLRRSVSKVYFEPHHPPTNLTDDTLNTEAGRSRAEWTAKENRLASSSSASSLCSSSSRRKQLEQWMEHTDLAPRKYAEVANLRRGVPRFSWQEFARGHDVSSRALTLGAGRDTLCTGVIRRARFALHVTAPLCGGGRPSLPGGLGLTLAGAMFGRRSPASTLGGRSRAVCPSPRSSTTPPTARDGRLHHRGHRPAACGERGGRARRARPVARAQGHDGIG